MPKLFYWRGAIGNELLLSEHNDAIVRLLNGTHAHGDVEKLAGHTIYSLRLNDRERLLFTTHVIDGQSYLLVLEHLPTHNYQNCRFLKSGVLARYLETHAPVLAATVSPSNFEPFEGKPFEVEPHDIKTPYIPVALDHFNGKFIQLSETQEEAHRMTLPGIISGPAGSGKSLLVLSKLIQWAEEQVRGSKVMYVTNDLRLTHKMKETWEAHPNFQKNKDAIEFTTYTKLLRKGLGDNPEGRKILAYNAEGPDNAVAINEERLHFDEWYASYLAAYHAKLKIKTSRTSAPTDNSLSKDTVYKEFRICGAYAAEEYYALGQKNTSLSSIEQKTWLYEAYQHYLADLAGKNIMHASFTPLQAVNRPFCIAVDEAQDFSQLQLDSLFALAANHNIVYCMDSRQMLFDTISSRALLLQRLHQKLQRDISHIELKTTNRCPLNITKAINKLGQMEHLVLGGVADKFESPTFETSTDIAGAIDEVHVLTHQDLLGLSWIKPLAETTDFAIVTTEESYDTARQWLDKHGINTPLLYTAAQIKGHEYPTVLVLDMCSKKSVFKLLPNELTPKVLESTPTNRARKQLVDARTVDELGAFQIAMNELHTACSRATSRLIICDEINRYNKASLALLKTDTQTEPSGPLNIKASSSEEWARHANALYAENTKIAGQIYRTKVRSGADEPIAFKKPLANTEVKPIASNQQIKTTTPTTKKVVAKKPLTPTQNKVISQPISSVGAHKKMPTIKQAAQDLKTANQPSEAHIKLLAEFTTNNLLDALMATSSTYTIQFITKTRGYLENILKNTANVIEFTNSLNVFNEFREKILNTEFINKFLLIIGELPITSELCALNQLILDKTQPTTLANINLIYFLYSQIKLDNHFAITKLHKLVSFDIDMVITNEKGTAAHLAAEMGRVKVIAKLHELGANLDSLMNNGVTPAFIAAGIGHVDVLTKLEDLKANINIPNDLGETPAFIAALRAHIDVLTKLKELGANLDTPNYQGTTPALIAAQMGHIAVLTKLKELGANLDTPNYQGATPAFIAAQMGHFAVLTKLNELGANLDTPNYQGATPAFIAAEKGHIAVLTKLKELGANLHTPNYQGTTPAFIAVQMGLIAVLTKLKELGIDLTIQIQDGGTLAFMAAQMGHLNIIDYLLKQKQDFEHRFRSTRKKLLEFCESLPDTQPKPQIKVNMINMIQQRLLAGDTEDNISLSPLNIATVLEHHAIVQAIEQGLKTEVSSNLSGFFYTAPLNYNVTPIKIQSYFYPEYYHA